MKTFQQWIKFREVSATGTPLTALPPPALNTAAPNPQDQMKLYQQISTGARGMNANPAQIHAQQLATILQRANPGKPVPPAQKLVQQGLLKVVANNGANSVYSLQNPTPGQVPQAPPVAPAMQQQQPAAADQRTNIQQQLGASAPQSSM